MFWPAFLEVPGNFTYGFRRVESSQTLARGPQFGPNVQHIQCNTVIHFCPKLREFLRLPLNRNFGWDFVGFFVKPEVSVTQITREILVRYFAYLCKTNNTKLWLSNTRSFGSKTRSFGSKNPKFWFENPEVSVRKPEVSVRKPEVSARKPEASARKPEVSGKNFKLETSVKVVFRNASVAETRNFNLLCTCAH
jgi:hypothetical protein